MTSRTDIEASPVLTGPWPDPVVPGISLPEVLLATAAEHAERPALVDASTGRTLHYGEFADGMRRVASGLAGLGLRSGDVFAILAPNSPEWLLACYGALAAGGVVTGINPLCTPGEVATQLTDAGARFILTAPEFLPTASAAAGRAAVGRASGRPRIIVLGSAPGDTIPFAALLAQPGRPPREPADPETGGDLAPGQAGELWVRTPALMTGYLGNPAASAATVDEDGWLHTGDIARFDTDGSLFLLDRAKELIKVKGFQVAPAELEALLRSHPAVADAAVIPVPDERAGELPKAYVVPAQQVTPQELIDYVAGRVAPYKRIHQVAFTDAIPTSPSGKTLRRLLIAGEQQRT